MGKNDFNEFVNRETSRENKVLWRIDCRAKISSDGYYDMPPQYTTIHYPYTPTLNSFEANVYLNLNFSFWCSAPGLENHLMISFDGKQIDYQISRWKANFFTSRIENSFFNLTKSYYLGNIYPGSHFLEFQHGHKISLRSIFWTKYNEGTWKWLQNGGDGYLEIKWIELSTIRKD